MKMKQYAMQLAITLALVFTLAACGDDKAEDAGEKVDEMVQSAKDSAEDAKDELDDMATDAGNAVEDACEKVKEGVEAKDTDC